MLLSSDQQVFRTKFHFGRLGRIKYAAVALLLISFCAWAANYAFHIATAGPQYVGTTYEIDRIAEFEGANRIATQSLMYLGPVAIIRANLSDHVYIVYSDGKIAKFKVVNAAAATNRLLFKEIVPSVPNNANGGRGIPTSSGQPSTTETFSFERSDYLDSAAQTYFYELSRKILIPSVTVIWGPELTHYVDVYAPPPGGGGGGSGCDPEDGCPILE
jgi:hypothetical protein